MNDKYLYLLYPVIWLFPPVHEMGHVFICWLTGSRVTSLYFDSMFHEVYANNLFQIFHTYYEIVSSVIPLICFIIIWYIYLKEKLEVKAKYLFLSGA